MLKVTLSHKPFDRIEVPLASLPMFSDTRPLRRSMGLVDWRLNNRLSHLIEQSRLHGELGECLFLPTQGRLRAETLIVYGLGKSERWDPNAAETIFLPWIEKLEALKQKQWLLSLSGLTADFLAWRQGVRAFVNMLVHRAHSLSHEALRTQAVCRHLFLAERDDWVLETKKRRMDFGESVTLQYDLKAP